jgi:hypothetical protein
MRAIQIARLDGPGAAELVEIDEPTDTDAVVMTCTRPVWRSPPCAERPARSLPAPP